MFDETKSFLAVPFNRYLVIGLLLLGLLVLIAEGSQGDGDGTDDRLEMHFFFSPSCPHCAEQKVFNARLEQEYPELLIVPHDVTIPSDARLLQIMAQNHSIGISQLGTPMTFIGNQVFLGYTSEETTGAEIREAVEAALEGREVTQAITPKTMEELTTDIDLPYFGRTDLSHLSLPLLAVTLGIVDGFNPCAMWVLVYLIALLMGFGDRKRMILVVAVFVLASGILYFLFMTAWLNVFLFLSYFRPVTIMVGLAALGGGILSVKDYIETKGAPVCKVTDVEGRKRITGDMKRLLSAPLTWATMLGIIILAFTVNSIEFLCSFALPAVFAQVLALSDLSFWEHYGYILLYDIFFMLDDMIIFGLAAWTVSGVSGETYSKYCKVIGGLVLLVLGLMLIFAPQLLS